MTDLTQASNAVKAADLFKSLQTIDSELDACVSVLTDGIEYDQAFYDDVHAHMKALTIKMVRVKAILIKRYGVVAI